MEFWKWETNLIFTVLLIKHNECIFKKATWCKYQFILLVALASFATFVLVDPANNILDSETAFVSLTLFNTMRGPLFLLPFGIVSIIQGAVSISRINTFLNLDELNPENVSTHIHLYFIPVMTASSELLTLLQIVSKCAIYPDLSVF